MLESMFKGSEFTAGVGGVYLCCECPLKISAPRTILGRSLGGFTVSYHSSTFLRPSQTRLSTV